MRERKDEQPALELGAVFKWEPHCGVVAFVGSIIIQQNPTIRNSPSTFVFFVVCFDSYCLFFCWFLFVALWLNISLRHNFVVLTLGQVSS